MWKERKKKKNPRDTLYFDLSLALARKRDSPVSSCCFEELRIPAPALKGWYRTGRSMCVDTLLKITGGYHGVNDRPGFASWHVQSG